MFASAVSQARDFTRALVVSRVNAQGDCGSTVGAFVVVNPDGWVLTAKHMVDAYSELGAAKKALDQFEAEITAIKTDKSLNHEQRERQLKRKGNPDRKWVRSFSFWWGNDGWQGSKVYAIPEADLALVQLTNFDPSQIVRYPTFKDPAKDINPGTSLCRLGFPFNTIKPTYDAVTQRFTLAALELIFFPNEGILTRIVAYRDDPTSGFIGSIETSSAGLRGQSGGPIFDQHGTVWGIQSRTAHLPLGFSPPQPGNAAVVEHQFLNVGLGAHPATIAKLLSDHAVAYTTSAY